MPDLQPAIWDGPFEGELSDSSLLLRGETHLVTSEDAKSAWWLPTMGEPASEPEPEPEPESTPAPEPESESTSQEGGF